MGSRGATTVSGPVFCELCEVTLDLHDGPDTCVSAGMKADLIAGFFGGLR